MFNLDQAIAEWRKQLAAGGIDSTVVDELESHLRDDIETQLRLGVDESRAFELATRRLGMPAELSQEFAKSAEPEAAPRRPFLWCFYFLCAATAVLIDLWTLISFELSPGERVGAACGVTTFGLYLLALPVLPSWRRGALDTYLLGMMKALGILVPLWSFFAFLTAVRIVQVEIGIIPQMIMWSLCAAYGLTALALGLQHRGGLQGGSGGGFLSPWPIPPIRPRPPNTGIPVPPSDAFTPTARRALQVAREEALSLGHDYIGTEHVLLGVLSTAGDALAQMLQRNGLNSETIRGEVCRLISGFPARALTTQLPLTPRARKALQFAGREANALQPAPIGGEHLLLGLLLEGSGVAALALNNLGVRLERLRMEISRH